VTDQLTADRLWMDIIRHP